MPRRVDQAAQFASVREASFAIVLDRGAHDLSRRAVADNLGISDGVIRRLVDPGCRPERLAADEVENRRRAGRWFPPERRHVRRRGQDGHAARPRRRVTGR